VSAVRCAVLTVSDRCARAAAVDESGPAVAEMLRQRLVAEVVATQCLPDERDRLAACFAEWCRAGSGIDLVVSTGGTGLSPRDVTPEAALCVIERRHDGLMELARARCGAVNARAYLSRGVAGVAGRTLIVTLPGSVRGATETLGALLDVLPHAVATLRGTNEGDAAHGGGAGS